MNNYLIAFGITLLCLCSLNLKAELLGNLVNDVVDTADDITLGAVGTAENVANDVTGYADYNYPANRAYYDSDGDYIIGLESENDRLRAENMRLQRERRHVRNRYTSNARNNEIRGGYKQIA